MKTRFNVALVANSAPEVPRWVVERLEDQNIDLMYRECTTKEELKETAANAEVVWVMGGSRVISAEALHLFKKCGAILRTGSGTDNIPVEQATALGIIVVNTPEATAEAVAEHTIGLLFGVTRRIAFHDRRIRTGVWDVNKNLPDCHLAGQVLGLVGCGHIAQLVARRLTGFEMSILGFDPFVPQESMKNHGVREAALEQLIVESDFVSLHCPLTASTRNLINKERLRMMKRRAILINT